MPTNEAPTGISFISIVFVLITGATDPIGSRKQKIQHNGGNPNCQRFDGWFKGFKFCPFKLLAKLFYLNNGTGNDCPKQRMEMEVFEGTMSS